MPTQAGKTVRPEGPPPRPGRPRGKDPAWARVMIIVGALIMVVSGAVAVLPTALANWATKDIPQAPLIPTELVGDNIDGAINLLLLGMDERDGSSALIRADTIIILHIPKTHDKAYLISLPRDADVHIPDFPETHFTGYMTKINAAFAYGARTPDGKPDDSDAGRIRGSHLTAETINNLVPGGLKMNGAAIINFDGFRDVLAAIHGVHMCVDVETRSIHFDKAGKYHTTEVPYDNRRVYKVGCYDFDAGQALDYARQRHFDNGDYTRQRHQQQLLMAIFKKLFSAGTLSNPANIVSLQKSAGKLPHPLPRQHLDPRLGLHAQADQPQRPRDDQDEWRQCHPRPDQG